MEGSRRHTVGRRKRQENGKGERVKTNGRRREGTRWEHVSHTEIVNYSFVLRRVGVIWKRDDGAGRGREYRGGMDGERRRYRGEREKNNAYAHARMGEREMPGCATRRDAGERTRRCISCFIGPLRPMLVTEVGWAVVRRWPVRARGKDEKRG